MEITNRIVYLLHKHVRQELNAEELTELEAWANRHPTFRQLLDEASDEKSLTAALQAFDQVYGDDPSASIARMEERISQGIGLAPEEPSAPARVRRLRKWLPYAAAILIAATTVIYTFFEEQSNQKSTIVNLQSEDIAPGGNRATLILADGRVIDLSETQTGIIIAEKNITYNSGDTLLLEPSETLVLTTPKGGTYQITLSDGTEVWLNAASTLKYPSRFDESERVVEVSGEAYFAVAKDRSKPFKVNSRGQTVEVLGTEFNISAYPADNEIKTTLVEGKVKVSNLKSQISNLLKPGEQAVVNGSTINISNVSVEPYTAWKEGFFYFDNVPPRLAIEQIARWYDLEVLYEGTMPTTFVFGMVDRAKPLSAVLNSFAKSGLDFETKRDGSKKQLIVRGK